MLREISRPQTNELLIRVPDEYVGKELEIMIVPSLEIIQTSKEDDKISHQQEIKTLFENAKNHIVDASVDLNKMANEVNG